MTTESPTLRQRDVLKAIDSYQRAWGFSITIRELGQQLGIKSTNGVAEHLAALIRKGFLERGPRLRARTLTITDAGRREIEHG